VVLNGGISDFKDVQNALAFTGCDGVMSSESILEYPALFDPSRIYDLDELTLEYFDMYEKYPGEADLKILRSHMHKFLHSGFTVHGHTDLRDKLNQTNGKPESF
jgi:tRNA-dihydrouridine synthase 1